MHPRYANGKKIKFGDIIKGEPVTWMKVFSDKSWIVGGDCYETEGSKDAPLNKTLITQETSEIMQKLQNALSRHSVEGRDLANVAICDFIMSLGYEDVAYLYNKVLNDEGGAYERF